jgi:hypothetical protein
MSKFEVGQKVRVRESYPRVSSPESVDLRGTQGVVARADNDCADVKFERLDHNWWIDDLYLEPVVETPAKEQGHYRVNGVDFDTFEEALEEAKSYGDAVIYKAVARIEPTFTVVELA